MFNHFLLDWVSHGPDMPVVPDGRRFRPLVFATLDRERVLRAPAAPRLG